MSNTNTYNKTAFLGNYPEHWKVLKLKHLGYLYSGMSGKTGEDFLNEQKFNGQYIPFTSICNGMVVKSTALKPVAIYEGENQNEVVKNDLFFLMSSENFADIGKTAILLDDLEKIYLNSFCKGFRITNNEVDAKFLNYCLNSNHNRQKLAKEGNGFTRINLRKNSVMSFEVALPPIHSQLSIVNYLDTQSQKITHFIAKKQQFIALLKEQRQSVINEAVTKGIDKKVKLKNSGIKWLGNIPEHWKVRKLRYCGQCQNGLNKGGEFFGSGYPFYSYGDIYNNEILPTLPIGLVMSSAEDRNNCSVQEGDVFFTRTSEVVDEIAIASTCFETTEDATFSGFLIRFRPFKNIIDKSYSTYYFRCQLLRAFFVKEMNIITRASMSQDLLKNLPVLIPPIIEQKAIANLIISETAAIDKIIAKTLKEIEFIKEYKVAMIAEAVMGKINFNKQANK